MCKQLYLLETKKVWIDEEIQLQVELGDPSEEFDIIRITGSWFTENPSRWDYDDHYDTIYKEEPVGQKKYTLWMSSIEAYYDVVSRFAGIGWYDRLTFWPMDENAGRWEKSIPQEKQTWTIDSWTIASTIPAVRLGVLVNYKELEEFRGFLRNIPYKVGYTERMEFDSGRIKTITYK